MGTCTSTEKKILVVKNKGYDYEWSNFHNTCQNKRELSNTNDFKIKVEFLENYEEKKQKKKFLICKHLYISPEGKINSIVPLIGSQEKIMIEGQFLQKGNIKFTKKEKKLDELLQIFYDGEILIKKNSFKIEGSFNKGKSEESEIENKSNEFEILFSQNKYKVGYSDNYFREFYVFLDVEETDDLMYYISGISSDERGISIWRGLTDEEDKNKIMIIQQYIQPTLNFNKVKENKKIIYEGMYDRNKKSFEGLIYSEHIKKEDNIKFNFILENR